MAFSLLSQPLSLSLSLSSSTLFANLSLSSKKPFSSSLPYKWRKLPLPAAAAAGKIRQYEDSFAVAKDPSFLANNDKKRTSDVVTCDSNAIDEAPISRSSLNGNFTFGCLEQKWFPLAYMYDGMKMALLVGLLIFQGSQRAIADAGFAGRMQSLGFFGDLDDISTGFASAFLLIFFSELGDKTFFIAALLAARDSGIVVFIGTFGALAVMTLVSVILGRTFHYVDGILPFRLGDIDLPIDDIAAVCLLVYFGVTTLLEASSGDGLKIDDEQKEVNFFSAKLTPSISKPFSV